MANLPKMDGLERKYRRFARELARQALAGRGEDATKAFSYAGLALERLEERRASVPPKPKRVRVRCSMGGQYSTQINYGVGQCDHCGRLVYIARDGRVSRHWQA